MVLYEVVPKRASFPLGSLLCLTRATQLPGCSPLLASPGPDGLDRAVRPRAPGPGGGRRGGLLRGFLMRLICSLVRSAAICEWVSV